MNLTVISVTEENKIYQDENFNTIKTHVDGTFLEVTFEGVIYESYGSVYTTYWKKVGARGRISKAFENWFSEVEKEIGKL